MVGLWFPTSVKDLTPQLLTTVIQEFHPGVVVEGFDVVQNKSYGEAMVSTSARATLQLRYGEGATPDLPSQVILKLSRGIDTICGPLYANEVRFYCNLRGDRHRDTTDAGGCLRPRDDTIWLPSRGPLTALGPVSQCASGSLACRSGGPS